MAVKAEPDKTGKYLRVTITGPWPSPMEQAQLRADLMRRGIVGPRTVVLVDMRGVTTPPTPEEVRNAVATAVAQEAAPIRRAFLVETQAQHDAARAMQELGAFEGAPIRVFKDEAAAIRWLTGLPSAPPATT
jgi:hypothetical protein